MMPNITWSKWKLKRCMQNTHASVRTTYEFCYNEYEEEDLPIFSWAPKGRPGWLTRLHEHGIGERVFYVRLDDEYYESGVGVIDEDTYRVVSESHEADIGKIMRR